MNADDFNRLFPVGQRVVAYPGAREDEGIRTVTRTPAWTLGHGAAVVSVEGYAGGIALTHVDPICGSQCPTHDHICLRSPKHCSNCRDQKQKGTESCDWDPKYIRAAVRHLLRDLRFYQDPEKACWIVPSPQSYALVVPAMYGAMSFLRGYRRTTVEEAARRGLAVLGADQQTVPVFDYEPEWLKRAVPHPIEGRTITLGGAA